MHVRKGAWRHLLAAAALVTFALPLATPLATPASAQQGTPTEVPLRPHSIATTGGICLKNNPLAKTPARLQPNCYVSSDPDLAFNIIGTSHTVTFTCGEAVGPAAPGAPLNDRPAAPTDLSGGRANAAAGIIPGCYNVSASVTDETQGTASNFTAARCGRNGTTLQGSTVNCAAYASPLCPVGSETTPTSDYCATPDANAPDGSQMQVTINPGAPHSYLITFTGYTPLLATCASGGTVNPNNDRGTCTLTGGGTGFACPAGFIFQPGPFQLSRNVFAAPFEDTVTAPDGVCQFTVTSEKKYVEITNLSIVPVPGSYCATHKFPFSLIFSEGFKSFFGPACPIVVVATGFVLLKQGVNCANEPANGSSASTGGTPGDFPHGSTYQCVNGALSVIIPNIGAPNSSYNYLDSGPLPVTFTVNGPGSVFGSSVPSPAIVSGNGDLFCAGNAGVTVQTYTGFTSNLCPTGPGSGTIQACLVGLQPDTQGVTCSTPFAFSFLLPPAQRVVPYVRWAGEKQVLTKCFGGAGLMAGAPVEFTLEGAGSSAQATLIPASTPDNFGVGAGSTGGGTATSADQNTVWTVTDENGCATVIVYAADEGVVNVDAAIFSTAPTGNCTGVTDGTPTSGCAGLALINEHAFEIFYLKFDHVDLENTTLRSYPYSTLTTGGAVNSFSFNTTPPGFSPGGTCSNPFPFGSFGSCSATTSGTFNLPSPPGATPPSANGYQIGVCAIDYVRALVHGYFLFPNNSDPSGRPATSVGIPNVNSIPGTVSGGVSGAVGSYQLPAGRWVLPEDWPVLATFAGFTSTGAPNDFTPSSVYAWDLNSGWVFNPGSERAVLCDGPLTAGPNNLNITAPGPAPANTGLTTPVPTVQNGPINNGLVPGSDEAGAADENPNGIQVSYGPCFSQTGDVNGGSGVGYSSAPDENAGEVGGTGNDFENCSDLDNAFGGGSTTGVTTGIGPFDITQVCTNPSPLPNSPSGGGLIYNAGAPGVFTIAPISMNSTYLPNGTLNQWDAPMPPAQISFGITSGPGFLGQVNKTGLYYIPTNGPGDYIYPDPFYTEAIPASPLIPPITNNGGYLWDTFGFRGGSTIGPIGLTAVCDPGQYCPPAIPVAGTATCPPGTAEGNGPASGTGSVPGCYVGSGIPGAPVDATVTQAECAAVGGEFTRVTTGAAEPLGFCRLPASPTGTVSPGLSTTNFGNTCPAFLGGTDFPSSSNSVTVLDATGFVPGLTVEVYDSRTGQTLLSGLTVASVAGNTITFNQSPNVCFIAGSATFISTQIGVDADNASLVNSGIGAHSGVAVYDPTTGRSTSTTVASVGGTYVWLNGAEALARTLGDCVLSRGPIGGPVAFGTCEPGVDFLHSGSLLFGAPSIQSAPIRDARPLFPGTDISDASVNSGTVGCLSTCNQGPYPFWQWVPNPAPTSTVPAPQSATMYSDNHGEAFVRLFTGVVPQFAVPATGCPTGSTLNVGGTACILSLSSLGNTPAFANVKAALGAFTAANPGCIQTNANGSYGPVATPATGTGTGAATTTVSPVVGANGPAAGQICINSLGGIEFGAGATLGTTNIQAIADYPYTRNHAAISSGNITKVFTSGFAKTLDVTPLPGGVAGPAGTTAYTVTITAKDVCGNPIVGEPVNVFALTGAPGAVVLAPTGVGGTSNGTTAATVVTDATGTATLSLEVLSQALGNQALVIKAVFPFEKVERFKVVQQGVTPGQTATVIYPPGYSMVGSPSPTNFSAAEALFSYGATTGAYTQLSAAQQQNVVSSAPSCTGYYAYFAAAAAVTFQVTSTAGQTATCSLAAGWNLVGNPFGSDAKLPAGVSGYYFNGTGYDVRTTIPLGGAVFIFNDGTLNSLVVTAS